MTGRSSLLLAVFASALVAIVACSDDSEREELASAAGGTPAPDGARGFCCPAKTGGCALTGGYREEGTCPTSFDICDNMCEQRIVKDEHGCDSLTYKIPARTTTYAGTASCDAPVFNQDPPWWDAGDAGDAGDGGDVEVADGG